MKEYNIPNDEYNNLSLSMAKLFATFKTGQDEVKERISMRDRLKALEMFMQYTDAGEFEKESITTPELKIEIVDNEDLEKYMYEKGGD